MSGATVQESERANEPAKIPPKYCSRSRSRKVPKPVIPCRANNQPREGDACILQNNPEFIVVFDEIDDADNEFRSVCARHKALHLTPLMQPQLPEVCVDGATGLPPHSKGTVDAGLPVKHREDCRAQCGNIRNVGTIAAEFEPLPQCRKTFASP